MDPKEGINATAGTSAPSGESGAAGSQPDLSPSGILEMARSVASSGSSGVDDGSAETGADDGETTQGPDTGTDLDEDTDDTGQGGDEGEGGEADNGKPAKYKTLEEATRANSEAMRKITEQGQEIARLNALLQQRGTADTGQGADGGRAGDQTQGGTSAGGDGKDGGNNHDLLADSDILTPDEAAALWQEDPAAAASYQDRLVKTMVSKALEPVAGIIKDMQAKLEAQQAVEVRRAHNAAMETLKANTDKAHGEGTFEAFMEKAPDPKHIERILNDDTREEFLAISEKNPAAGMRYLVRQHVAYMKRVRAQKNRASHPAETGTGAGTRRAPIEVNTPHDALEEAKRRVGRA